MTKIVGALVASIGVIGLLLLLGFLCAYPTMWLVNYLFASKILVALFGVSRFDIWHAWALNILASFLFKSNSTSSSK
jgi:hypothetical protein